MMMRTAMLCGLLLLTAMGCQSPSQQKGTTEADKALLGYFPERCNCDIPPALPTLRAVTGGKSLRVGEQRTKVDDGETVERAPDRCIRGYSFVLLGPKLSPENAGRLAALLTDPRAFANESACRFTPEFAFTLTTRNGQTVTVLICVKCAEWMAWLNEDKQIGGGSFIGLERELIAFLREVFPTDGLLRTYELRNCPARIYHVEALASPATERLPEDQRQAVRNRVEGQLLRILIFSKEGRDNGGYADFTTTADGLGYIVHARPEHHAAIEKLAGFKRVYPK